MKEIAASVLLKLLINGNERCHNPDAPSVGAELFFFKCKQHTIYNPRGPGKYNYRISLFQ